MPSELKVEADPKSKLLLRSPNGLLVYIDY